VHDSKTEFAIGLRACIMSDRSFSPPSCVESLPRRRRSLGICRIIKMSQRLIGEIGERRESGVGAEGYTSIEVADPSIFKTVEPKVGSLRNSP
jgi:hypothetical protein